MHYCGLDVSRKATHVYIEDAQGRRGRGDRGDDATIATRSLPVGASSLIAALSSAPALVAIAMMNAPNSRMNRIGVSSMAHLRERGNGRETIMRRLHAGCVVALPRLTRLGVGDVKHSRSPGPQGGR